MKIPLLTTALLATLSLPALAHDSGAHSRRPVPAECTAFVGKDPKTLDLKDPAIKAAHEKCQAAKKAAKKAAETEHDH